MSAHTIFDNAPIGSIIAWCPTECRRHEASDGGSEV